MATESAMKVQVLNATPNAERVCVATAKQCMTSGDAITIYDRLTDEEIEKTLQHCIKAGHLAVLASAHVSVAVNVTRECLTQLNTHAFIKTVTQSQQYIDHRDFRYHIPEIMIEDEEQLSRFTSFMEIVQKEYNWHRDRIYNRLTKQGMNTNKAYDMAKSNARAVLVNAAEANTVLSGNMWAWYLWLKRRACNRNTPFTLTLARTILEEFRERWPAIFELCGAPCEIDECKEQKPCDTPYVRRDRRDISWKG